MRRSLRTTWHVIGLVVLWLAIGVSCAPGPPPTPTPAPKPGPVGTAPAPAAPAPAPAATAAPAKPAAPAPTAAPAKPAAPAPTAPAPAKPAASTKDTWVIATSVSPDTLDPTGSTAQETDTIIKHMLQPLIEVEGPNLKQRGALAERWENPNPTTWRFFLRKGVTFHNGDEFDAQDVKYTIETFLDPKTKNRAYVADVTAVNVIDKYTVDIVTKQPFPGLLANLMRVPIMPRLARPKLGDGFATSPIGTGPYKFTRWVREDRLEMEANEKWWRGQPTPKKLVFRPVKDPSTRVAELKTGGVDIIYGVSLPQVKDLTQSGAEVARVKGARVAIYAFNQSQKPFDNVKVRQALNYAVDREAIVKQVLEGYGEVLAGIFSSGWLGYDPSVKPYPYDPAKARQLLAEAGYPNGFQTTWNISSGVFIRDKEIAEAMANQLAQVGVKVNLVPTDRTKLTADSAAGKFDGMISIQWGSVSDPSPMLAWVFMREGNNALGNPEIKKLIASAGQELDLGKREAIYKEMFRLSADQAPWLFVNATDELWGKRKEIPWQPYHISGSKGYIWYFVPPNPAE